MKDLFATAFRYEISQVFENGQVGPNYVYGLSLIANGKEIPVQSVIGTHRLRDYINNYTDLFSITFLTIKADLDYKIKPFQSNLEAVIVRKQVSTNPTIQNRSGNMPQVVARYKAVMTDSSKDLVEQNNPFVKDKDVMGRTLSEPVTIQLIDPSTDKLRLMTIGTIPRGHSGMEVIETLLTKFSKEATNLARSSPLGLDIAPGYNTEKRESIVLDYLTKVTSMPKLVEANCGGIYPAGFSYYLQDRIWYIYPPYDPERYHKVKRNLTVVNIPKNRIAGIEKTYLNTQNQLIFLSTGDVKHVDYADQNQLSYGNGARFLDATKLTKMGKMIGNRFQVDSSKNMNEIQSVERADGLSVAYQGTKGITSNKNAQLSLMAARMGSFVQVEWSNSDDSLIYPGMPVRYLYLVDTKPTEAFGCVAAIETYQVPVSENFASPKLTSKSAVTLFIHHPT